MSEELYFGGSYYIGANSVACRMCQADVSPNVWRINGMPLCKTCYDMWRRRSEAAKHAVSREFFAEIKAE